MFFFFFGGGFFGGGGGLTGGQRKGYKWLLFHLKYENKQKNVNFAVFLLCSGIPKSLNQYDIFNSYLYNLHVKNIMNYFKLLATNFMYDLSIQTYIICIKHK